MDWVRPAIIGVNRALFKCWNGKKIIHTRRENSKDEIMNSISYLVPTRFLAIISQLVIVIMILLSRTDNILYSLPATYTADDYNKVDVEFYTALSLTLVLLVFELLSFFSGTTMFIHYQNIISALAHICGSVTSVFLYLCFWPISNYWYIFGFCNVLPSMTEFIYIIEVHCFNLGF